MKKHLTCLFACFLLAQGFAQSPQFVFNAVLNGAEAVPAVSTEGKGLLTLLFNQAKNKMQVSGMLTQLDGDATALNLYFGKKGLNGAVVLDLMPLVIGRRIAGEMDVPPGLTGHLFRENVYALVRTSAHPTGEIRGQMIPETDLNYAGIMTGANMVPAVNTPATVLGTAHFPVGSDEVVFLADTKDLSSAVTSLSVYEGQPGSNGTLLHTYAIAVPGELVVKVMEFDELGAQFIDKCNAGQIYYTINTANFPDGEVRGQFSFLGYFNGLFSPNGFQNVPQNPTEAFGIGVVAPNATLDSLTISILLNGIAPTAGYVRKGPAMQNGPVLFTIPNISADVFQFTFPITPTDLEDFIANRLYVNFTTTAFPDGEIRGQMSNTLRRGYAFDLCGSQQVPPNNSTALGMAMVSVDQADCYINYKVMLNGLTGSVTGASIHTGDWGLEGPPLYPMPNDAPLLQGIGGLVAGEGQTIEYQGTYISVRTDGYPAGEIRGQIRRGLGCPLLSGTALPSSGTAYCFPNPVRHALTVRFQTETAFEGQIVVLDAMGQAALQQAFNFNSGETQLSIPVEHLAAGLYRIVVRENAGGKVVWREQFIKG